MSKKIVHVLMVLVMILVMTAGLNGQAVAQNGGEKGPGWERKIIVFNESVDTAAKNGLVNRLGVEKVKSLPLVNGMAVWVPPGQLKKLEKEGIVKRVDNDDVVQLTDQTTPWGLCRIGGGEAWSTSTGAGVKIAIMDTGVDTAHTDLNIAQQVHFVDPFLRESPDHGTFVAGIIGAQDNGSGTVGMAPDAELYSLGVFTIVGAFVSDLVDGLQWCIDNDMQVINMSWGMTEDNTTLHDAIIDCYNAGIVCVASAGNEGPADNSVLYPAKYAETIAVSAIGSHSGNWTVEGGAVEISTEQAWGGTRSMKMRRNAGIAAMVNITHTAGANYAIRFRMYKDEAGRFMLRHGDGTKRAVIRFDTDEDIESYDGAWNDSGQNCTAAIWELYEYYDFNWTSYTYDMDFEGSTIMDDVGMQIQSYNENEISLLENQSYTGDWVDDFIVRNYRESDQPTWSAWGGEEIAASSDYDYRKQITVNNAGAALTDYQMDLTIVSGSGSDSGATVYLNGHALNWPNDIRFTTADGTTMLDFWREESDGTDGTWWVELDSLTGSGDTTFYLYYGKDSDTDASNGTDTFIVFDDFERDSNGSAINSGTCTPGSEYFADFSSRGPEIDLVAPGDEVYSTLPGGGFGFAQGTSFSCPYVVGTVALMLNTPGWDYDVNSNSKWDPAEIKAKLTDTAEDLGWSAEWQGAGLVDAAAAVESPAGTADPTLTLSDSTSGSTNYTNNTTVGVVVGNDATAVAWLISETQSAQPTAGDPQWSGVEPTTYSFDTATEELKTVYIWVKDAADNINDGPVDAQITLDITAAMISATSSAVQGDSSATITWTTNDDSDSVVNYGTTTSLGSQVADGALVTSHSVDLTGLAPGTTYYYEVRSTDEAGNEAVDDNIGAYYSFSTTDASRVELFLPAADLWPSTTNPCADAARTEMLGNKQNLQLLAFDKDFDEYAETTIAMPSDWDGGTITARFYWTANNATADPVVWGVQGRIYADGGALDQGWGSEQIAADAHNSAVYTLNISPSTAMVTLAGTPGAGGLVQFRIFRDADNGSDSLDTDALLIGVMITYNKL